jgi:SAM-dependent methyltransferase
VGFSDDNQKRLELYRNNYIDLPFENFLREYRKRNILEKLKKYPHSRFLEVGCGPEPLFQDFSDYDQMTVVEPCITFCERAVKLAKFNSKILIINNIIENSIEILKQKIFDFIVIGGFLHETKDPDTVLQAIGKICSGRTVVYSFVPNANSFHRLLALQMGIIKSIYQKSEHDKLFHRQTVFDADTFSKLFINQGFEIIESGSYFIKPFTHYQMGELLKKGIIDKCCLEGLAKMTELLPEMGTELFNCCKNGAIEGTE